MVRVCIERSEFVRSGDQSTEFEKCFEDCFSVRDLGHCFSKADDLFATADALDEISRCLPRRCRTEAVQMIVEREASFSPVGPDRESEELR